MTRVLIAAVVVAATLSGAAYAIAPIYPRPIRPIDPPICPQPPSGYYYRWIPATYYTVWDRVWIDTQVVSRPEWIEISPGRWVERWIEVTIAAHWERTARQVEVTPGHWELVRMDPPRPMPMPRPMPDPVVYDNRGGTVGVSGYSTKSSEDMSKFSGLSEWPK